MNEQDQPRLVEEDPLPPSTSPRSARRPWLGIDDLTNPCRESCDGFTVDNRDKIPDCTARLLLEGSDQRKPGHRGGKPEAAQHDPQTG